MNPTSPSNLRRLVGPSAAAIGLAAAVILGASAHADMYRPGTTTPGGVPAQATITSITPAGTNTSVCWYGMQGWYSVEAQAIGSTNWTSLGRTAASDFSWCLTVPTGPSSNYLFRLNQNNAYAGSGACGGCHGDKHSEWAGTAHASGLNVLTAIGMGTNAACLACHTTGYGQPTGFTDTTRTAYLGGVGCEACHGPAAWHKYSDHNIIRPAVSIDPKICGGCHQGSMSPTYNEYETTLHAEVNDDVKYGVANGTYYPGMLVVRGTNAFGVNVVTNGTPGSTNCYGYYVTTNPDLTLKTNYTTGIVHSGNGPGSGYNYDPGEDRAVGCGICHSAATRMAQLQDYEARLQGQTNALTFPAAQDSGAWSAACATCHDPHSNDNTAQLRNPAWSSNYFTMATTADKRSAVTTNFVYSAHPTLLTNTVFYSAAFANMYDPNVQVCGQCHNSRGARWDGRSFGYYLAATGQSVTTNGPGITWGVQTNISFSRPPHHSPQYNILVGIVQSDYLTVGASGVATNYSHRHGTAANSSGAYNTNQCATCHVPSFAVNAGTNYTGHTFELMTNNCTLSGCHGSVPNYANTMNSTSNSINSVVALLNSWAIANGTNVFGAANAAKYGANGWEYTTPGGLNSTVTNAAPSSGDQLKIPDFIKQARFNLYMVSYDQSMGVHNPSYASFLLSDSTTKVNGTIIGATNKAYFTATATKAYIPFTSTFTCYGTGITNYLWDFGGGSTSTSPNPSFTYTTRGTNTVSLTVISGGVPTTYTRTNYIGAYVGPTPSFVADVVTGRVPLTVTFTNTSTGTDDVLNWRWTPRSGLNVTNNGPIYSYTYTNASTNTVSLRAYTPVGSVTTSSNAYIIVTP
jgi:PKD repeat protein